MALAFSSTSVGQSSTSISHSKLQQQNGPRQLRAAGRPGRCSCVSQSTSSSPDSTSSSSRREMLVWSSSAFTAAAVAGVLAPPAHAGFKKELKKRKTPLADYTLSELDGLRYFDKAVGRGREIQKGDIVVVHFDCRFNGVDAVSSRYARTLGGNRTIAEPLEFVAGEPVNVSARKINDSAGGLFAGGSGPKPPPAISTAVIGMKPGGRRTVLVDIPELGYPKGNQEIPPGAAFELSVDVLSAVAAAAGPGSSSGAGRSRS